MKKSTGVILVLIIVLLIGACGVEGYFLIKGNNDSNKEVADLKSEFANLSKKIDDNTNEASKNATNNNNTKVVTYSSIKGAYASENKHYVILYQDGTFVYSVDTETDCHYEGYYIVDGDSVVMHCILDCANDPGASITTKNVYVQVIDDNTIKVENERMSRSSEIAKRARTQDFTEGIDIGGSISGRQKNNFLYVAD